MAETINISAMAEILSNELFSEFMWERFGQTNENWPCENPEHHKVATHPTDVVFFYDEPYKLSRTYINCDLKSYAKGSIQASLIKDALESLSKQVACAERSGLWRERYTHEHVNFEVYGLLFIYNYDGEYDREFSRILSSVKNEKLDHPKRSKLFVLGPEDIFWLDNVRYEIRQMRGASGIDCLPRKEQCRFYYPQLIRNANLQPTKARAATLEMMKSSWLIMEYFIDEGQKSREIIIFYRKNGSSSAEFIYLIDYLRHYQLIDASINITIKIFNGCSECQSHFNKAVDQYIDVILHTNNEASLSSDIRRIKFLTVTQVKTVFRSQHVGFKRG